jgi:hypothetical protein
MRRNTFSMTLRVLMVAILVALAGCKKSSSSGGPPAAPPPPALPAITSPSSPITPAALGVPISQINFAASGAGPHIWSVTAGAPPTGLSLTPSGIYSGTPTVAGSFTFTVRATNTAGFDENVFTHAIVPSVPEVEPNDTSGNADFLPAGLPGTGVVDVDDLDFWAFDATVGQVIEVELFGTRRDFVTWDTNVNFPRVSVIGPNGTSFLVGHDFFNAGTVGWFFGAHDLDVPRYRIPATGTYFVLVEPYIPGTPGGAYAVKVNVLSLGAIQVESEYNSDNFNADPITPGTMRGVKDDFDDDWFTFTISAPTIVYFEITAYRNGLSGFGGFPDDDYFDPRIELYVDDGFGNAVILAANDDCFFFDSAINYLITVPGTYYLLVTESPFGTDGDSNYFLTFTSTDPGSDTEIENNDLFGDANAIAYGDIVSASVELGVDDFDWYSFTGTAGDIVRIFWFEAGANDSAVDFVDLVLMLDDVTFIQSETTFTGVFGLACVRAILPTTGTYYIRATPVGGLTNYSFQLVQFKTSAFETEANDTPGTAEAIPGPGRVSGIVDPIDDVDVFSFTAVQGEVVTFSIYAGPGPQSDGFNNHSGYGSFLAPDLEVVNASGTLLGTTLYLGANNSGESVTNGLATIELTFFAPSAGTFYVRVFTLDGTGSPEHLYVLEKR